MNTEIKTHIVNGDLYISLDGVINSSNAELLKAEIDNIIENSTFIQLVLDAENLSYISSAGLRIVLKLLKEKRNPKIINTSADIYDIFETTGFTEMMTIEKAYRKVSVDGCEIIGKGANGIVYRLDDETIIKTYKSDALGDMERERQIARQAFILGIPTAIPYDIVRVDDSYGAVFELLSATSITKLISKDPDNIDEYAKVFVDLLKEIHKTPASVGVFPDIKAVALDWAEYLKGYLDDDLWEKLCALIKAVPKHNYLIHGDYHCNNVLIQQGEPMLIDMDTLAVGHPVFELASMYNAFVGFPEIDHSISMSFLGLPYDISTVLWDKVLKLYLNSDDEEYVRSVEKKAMLVGYTRLYRRTLKREQNTIIGEKRLKVYKDHLCSLIAELDNLDF